MRAGPRAALLALALLACLRDRAAPAEPAVITGMSMGTTWRAELPGARDPGRAERAVQEALDRVDASLSTWKPDSELSRLGRAPVGEPQRASAALMDVLLQAAEVSEASGGAFDVTVAPLVDLWGFGPAPLAREPEEAEIQAAAALVDWRALQLDPGAGTVTRARAGVRADLSAIAKGYAVDRAWQALEALGYRDALIEVGGEVRVEGRRADGGPWQVGVAWPDGGEGSVAVIGLSRGAMATSGDYRRFREVEGRRLSHTLDPRTGRPVVSNLAQVSVLAPRCSEADAWATALDVLGPEAGFALAEARGLAALFIQRLGEGRGGFVVRATERWQRIAAGDGAPGGALLTAPAPAPRTDAVDPD